MDRKSSCATYSNTLNRLSLLRRLSHSKHVKHGCHQKEPNYKNLVTPDLPRAKEHRASVRRVGQSGQTREVTFSLINHVQHSKGGRGGDKGDKHTTSLHPYQSRTKEKDGEMKTGSRRPFTLSIMSGRLVAASTVTSRSCSMPSISVRS